MVAASSPDDVPVLCNAEAGVATLTLNRPRQRNSLSEDLMVALTGQVEALANDAAVKAIADSYDTYGGINHIEGPNLPSREVVEEILEEILSLIFPGYVGPASDLDSTNITYFVGQRCASIFKRLSQEAEKSFRHECRVNPICDRTTGECHSAGSLELVHVA